MERINLILLSHSLGECYLTTILIVALLCFIHHSCTYRHAASGTLPFRHRATFVQSLSFVATSGCPSRVPIFYRSSPFVFATTISARPVALELVLWSTSIVSSQRLSSPQPSSLFVPPVPPFPFQVDEFCHLQLKLISCLSFHPSPLRMTNGLASSLQ